MNHHILYFLLSFCLFLSACSSSRKKDQVATDQDLAAQTEQRQPEHSQPEQKMPPAPGSALVTAEILNIEESSKGFHCALKIISTHGYGANTPPLPEGTKVTASIRQELLEDVAADGAASPEKLSSGMIKNLTLKYQQVLEIPGADTTSWRILSIR